MHRSYSSLYIILNTLNISTYRLQIMTRNATAFSNINVVKRNAANQAEIAQKVTKKNPVAQRQEMVIGTLSLLSFFVSVTVI